MTSEIITMRLNSAKDLEVYKQAYSVAMKVFELSETDSSLDFAKDCNYITHDQHAELTALCG